MARSQPHLRPPARPRRGAARAFSLIELLVVVAIIAVLIGIVSASLAKARTTAEAVDCVARLRQIALGFHLYANDNKGRLPDPFANGTTWEQSLAPYVSRYPTVFRCNADRELAPALGSSYDWRDTGNERTTLAGRPLTDAARYGVVLTFEALPGWHAKRSMNAALADASARAMPQDECFTDLATPLR
jgi:prepilin-type N-terminal cleavage/methylation domain-containing protein